MTQIGVFGGTFAPFHNGHLLALKNFLRMARPDRCLVIPAGTPPHKQKTRLFTDEQRREFARLGCLGLEQTEICDYELRKGGRSYTSDTLAWLHRNEAESRLILYVGSDMLLTLQEWHEPKEIFRLAEIFALSRTGEDQKQLEEHKKFLEQNFGAVCRLEEADVFPVSSTEIREKWMQGEDVSRLVPPEVNRYLEEIRKDRGNGSKTL